MLIADKNRHVMSTDLSHNLRFFSDNLNKMQVNSDLTIGHLKINNSAMKDDLKDPQTVYSILEQWDNDTLLNAFFNHDLEAGNLKGYGETVKEIIIKRLSPETNYLQYETLGRIPYDKNKRTFIFKDYFIVSNQVYLYTIQPLTKDNHYGALQDTKPGLNTYDQSWLIDTDGTQIEILNCAINNINIITKDGIVETIGASKPYVNRLANLNYRSFQLTGTIAAVGDFNNHLIPIVNELTYTKRPDIQKMINEKFLEKTGNLPNKINNNIYNDVNFERKFREKVLKVLNNGKPKLLKTSTEGLMLVKLTNISITPKALVDRIIYDFSLTVTEVGDFNTDTMKSFNLKQVIHIE